MLYNPCDSISSRRKICPCCSRSAGKKTMMDSYGRYLYEEVGAKVKECLPETFKKFGVD